MIRGKKLELLFVGTVSRMRSATAHIIYERQNRFEMPA